MHGPVQPLPSQGRDPARGAKRTSARPTLRDRASRAPTKLRQSSPPSGRRSRAASRRFKAALGGSRGSGSSARARDWPYRVGDDRRGSISASVRRAEQTAPHSWSDRRLRYGCDRRRRRALRGPRSTRRRSGGGTRWADRRARARPACMRSSQERRKKSSGILRVIVQRRPTGQSRPAWVKSCRPAAARTRSSTTICDSTRRARARARGEPRFGLPSRARARTSRVDTIEKSVLARLADGRRERDDARLVLLVLAEPPDPRTVVP